MVTMLVNLLGLMFTVFSMCLFARIGAWWAVVTGIPLFLFQLIVTTGRSYQDKEDDDEKEA